MNASLITEQMLNGVQLGVMLFLMSAGLTLVFGIMNFINLTHGSLYMIGAFAAAAVQLATGSFALAILAEAVLSFIGVGPPPPTPTFGNIIADGRNYIQEAPWISLFPGIAIAMCVLGLNLLGDGLRDALDPRMKVER